MLAVDWGTTSLRIYRLDADGKLREMRQSRKGILNNGDQTFAATLEQEAGDWIAAGETPILMSGMIGSRQGWIEAPYVPCPAGITEIGAALSKVKWNTNHAWIAPGVQCHDEYGVYDVMRGEEVQVLGLLEILGPGEHLVCLPGTHSKWVVVRDQKIVSFTTTMTGELFAILKEHSILGRTMRVDTFSERTFLKGVARSSDTGGLLHHLFGVRAQVLAGKLTDSESSAYLSGILIGHELHSNTQQAESIHLLCSSELTKLYTLAGKEMNIAFITHAADTVTRGLYSLANYLLRNK